MKVKIFSSNTLQQLEDQISKWLDEVKPSKIHSTAQGACDTRLAIFNSFTIIYSP